jgi:hypothetical protein
MDQLQLPMSIFVYFQETPLTIERKDLQFSRGDIVIFLGDCVHAGGAWHQDQANCRLFCYLPTKQCTPSWLSLVENEKGELIEVTLRAANLYT